MFVNKDYPTEWALNPSNYLNMDNDQVDWAALAQEWIKMKETSIPSAPTPPSISKNPTSSSFGGGGGGGGGGGEAPMDMEFKDDEIPPAPPAPNISGTNNWNRWNHWESNWNPVGLGSSNWDWTNSVPPEASVTRIANNLMIPPPAPVISATPAFVDRAALGSTVAPLESPSSPSFGGYNTMTLPRSHFSNQVPNSGFWNNEQHVAATAPGTNNLPTFFKDARPPIGRIPSNSSATSLPTLDMTTSRNRGVKEPTPENDSLNTLDTIKRKQLPAWIREGLEKMEREKQKAIERERQAVLRKQELEECKKMKDQVRAVLSPDKSKFDSDSEKELPDQEFGNLRENSQDEVNNKLQKTNCDQASPDLVSTRPRKTRFRDASSPEKLSNVVQVPSAVVGNSNPAIGSCVNKEELLQSLMLQVRRSLTEILLEVTNDEIMTTCEQVWKNFQNKGKTLPASSANAAPVAQITRRLGLGIYSDSDSDSSDEQTVQHQSEKCATNKNDDSDEELKETLRQRQQAFKRTEIEIEASLAEEELSMQGKLAKNNKTETLGDRKDRERQTSNAADKIKHKVGHALQESSKNWKEHRENDNSSAGSRKSSFYNDNEGPPSDERIASKSISRSTPDRFNQQQQQQEEESSSCESGDQSSLSRRKHGSNNGKSTTSSSAPRRTSARRRRRRRRRRRSSDSTRRYSSSRSRSRSKNDSSSRENSCESASSRLKGAANPSGVDKTAAKESTSENYKSSLEVIKKSGACLKNAHYGKARSRSTSQSDAHWRSESRSRSRSNSTARSRQKRSRSRSYSSSFRRHDRYRSARSKHRSRSRSQSESRSPRSISRSRSRSRKRSKSSYSSKSTAGAAVAATKFEGARRRSTRSRSSERARRSRSNTRKSKSSHRGQRGLHRYRERDRSAGKRSARHHMD